MAPSTGTASATRNQAILAGSLGVRLFLAIVLTAVLGRVLSTEDFGFFAMVAAIVSVTSVLLDLGTGTVAVREIVRDRERERPLLEGLIAWRLAGGSVLAAVVIGLAMFEDSGERRAVLMGVAATVVMAASNALNVVFLVRQAHGTPALIGVFNPLFVIGGSIVFGGLRIAGEAFGWLIVAREVISIALVRRFALKRLTFRPVPGFRGRGLRRFYAMASIHGLAVLSHTLYFHADVFMVRALRGPVELGAYASVFRLVNPLITVAGILMVPLFPVFAVAAVADRKRLSEQVTRTAWVLTGLAFLAAVGGSMLARDLESIVYGGRYGSGDLDSTPALRWLSLALAVALPGATFITALQADRKERLLLLIAASGFLTNVVGNLWFLPRFGFTAAAAVTFATEALVGLAAAFVFLRAVPVQWRMQADRLLVLAPGAALFLALSALDSPMWRVAVGLLVSIGGALAILRTPVGREYRAIVRGKDIGADSGDLR